MKTLLLLLSLNLFANSYVIVASKHVKEVSLVKLKALYLKKSFFINETKIVPVNLPANNPARISFEKNILKMDFNRLKSYWMKQHYLGHRPPITMKSQQSVVAFVQKVDGAIGYIERKNINETLEVLYEWKD